MADLILWDFDGPIIDSVARQHGIYDDLCKRMHLKPQWSDLEGFREWISGSFRYDAVRLGFLDRIDEANEFFRSERAERDAPLQRGVREVIESLRDKRQAVLTSDYLDYVAPYLSDKGLNSLFEEIFGRGNMKYNKPNPLAFMEIGGKLKVSTTKMVYIGDTTTDVEFARHAGVPIVAVSFGWNSRRMLEKANPDYLVDSSEELRQVLSKL